MFKVEHDLIAKTKLALQVFAAFLIIVAQVSHVKMTKVELPPHDELKCINFTKLKELHVVLTLDIISNHLHQCCSKNEGNF